MKMSCFQSMRLHLVWCACLCLTWAYAGHEQLHDDDAEGWTRRDYFYVGGQYVQTTLVCFIICVADERKRQWTDRTF
jgi:hypothetical protein